jgi:hypothetical protein
MLPPNQYGQPHPMTMPAGSSYGQPPPPAFDAAPPVHEGFVAGYAGGQPSYAALPEMQQQEPMYGQQHEMSHLPPPQQQQNYGQMPPHQVYGQMPAQHQQPSMSYGQQQIPVSYPPVHGQQGQQMQQQSYNSNLPPVIGQPPQGPQVPNRKPEGTGERCEYESEAAASYKDLPFAALFAAHALLFFVLAIIYGPNVSATSSSSSSGGSASDGLSQSFVIGILVCMCLLGAAIGGVWVLLLRRYAESMIKMTFVCGIGLNAALAVICFASNMVATGVFLVILSLLGLVWYRAIVDRIPLASEIMKLAVQVLAEYEGSIYIAYAAVVGKIAWVVFWLFVVAGVANSSAASQINGFVAFLFILALCWSLEVIRNIVHVTASGAAGAWFFYGNARAVTTNALKRACTTSFGSICLGSLLVAVLETVRMLVRSASRRSEFACVASCILGMLESLMRWINGYAYVYVAVYGMKFTEGATAAWELMGARGFDTIVNDDLTSSVLNFGTLVSAILCAVAGGGWAYSVNPLSQYTLWSFISFLIGGFMCTRAW